MQQIKSRLVQHGLLPEVGGVLQSLEAVYRPEHSPLSGGALRGLERAGVTLVAATSSKPEAVDRVIAQRVDRLLSGGSEASVTVAALRMRLALVQAELERLCTWTPDGVEEAGGGGGATSPGPVGLGQYSTIVIVSNDLDFRKEMEAARRHGFRACVMFDSLGPVQRAAYSNAEVGATLIDWEMSRLAERETATAAAKHEAALAERIAHVNSELQPEEANLAADALAGERATPYPPLRRRLLTRRCNRFGSRLRAGQSDIGGRGARKAARAGAA